MALTLTDVVLFLRDNGYTTTRAGKLVLTKKFHEDHATQRGAINAGSPAALVIIEPSKQADAFIKFILDAKVPARLDDNRGNPYYANKYSEEAAKVFVKMINQGIDYDLLVKSTMLYYRSGVKFKKAIGNYILQGDWRTDYEDLKNSAQEGADSLNTHIKQTISDGSHTPFTLG